MDAELKGKRLSTAIGPKRIVAFAINGEIGRQVVNNGRFQLIARIVDAVKSRVLQQELIPHVGADMVVAKTYRRRTHAIGNRHAHTIIGGLDVHFPILRQSRKRGRPNPDFPTLGIRTGRSVTQKRNITSERSVEQSASIIAADILGGRTRRMNPRHEGFE